LSKESSDKGLVFGSHKRRTIEDVRALFLRDLNQVSDMRLKALLYDLYYEFWLNEAIVNLFSDPEKIIEELSFYYKLKKLESLDLFDKSPKLLNNLRLFNQIRNRYGHVLFTENELDDVIVQKIGELVSVFGNDRNYSDQKPIDKFNTHAFETYRFLPMYLVFKIEGKDTYGIFTNKTPTESIHEENGEKKA
jgi:hypothetical protein